MRTKLTRSQGPTPYWSGQVSQLTGVNVRTLNLWAAKMATPATLNQNITRGQPRRWFYPDLIVLRAAKHLRDAGVPLSTVQRIVAQLRENAATDTSSLRAKIIVTSGADFWVVSQEADVADILLGSSRWRDHPSVFMLLHLGGVAREIDDKWQQVRAAYVGRQAPDDDRAAARLQDP